MITVMEEGKPTFHLAPQAFRRQGGEMLDDKLVLIIGAEGESREADHRHNT